MPDLKEVKTPSVSEEKKPRSQSAIAYPYFNMEASLQVAQAIQEKGGSQCSSEHLASFLGYSSTRSGTFLTRISAARMFGFVTGGGEALGVTARALSILSPVMPEDKSAAKIDAFLAVPLFKDIYERFKGKTLPPEIGLRSLLENTIRIVKDRIIPASRVFYESAEYAGFFDITPDRSKLITPLQRKDPDKQLSEVKVQGKTQEEKPAVFDRPRGGGGDGPSGIHAALTGLLRELPSPGPWDSSEKQRFLDAFKAIFDFIYPSMPSNKN